MSRVIEFSDKMTCQNTTPEDYVFNLLWLEEQKYMELQYMMETRYMDYSEEPLGNPVDYYHDDKYQKMYSCEE